ADRHLSYRSAAPDCDGIGRLDVALHRRLPAGRENVAEEQRLFVTHPLGNLDVSGVGKRHAQIFSLPARIPAGQMRVAEQTGRGVAEYLVGDLLVAVRPFANREVAPLALLAFTADDGEGYHDPVTLLQLSVHAGADFDNLAHHLVAHDVAGQHGRNEVVEQVQIRTADRAT